MQPNSCARAVLAALLCLLPAVPLGAQGNLQDQVAVLLTQADAGDVTQAFRLGDDAADLVVDAEKTDPLRDAVMASIGRLQDKGRLAAAIALRSLRNDATYGTDILEVLTPVAKSADPAVRSAAMSVLANDRYFNTRVLPKVQDLLKQNTVDELVPPDVRIEAALGLWAVGTSEQKGNAKQALESFLRSQDRELRNRGALALATINTAGGEAWQVLREIADQPTDSGRRAKLILQREEERRQFEAMLRRLMDQQLGKPAAGADADDFAILRELKLRIRAQHIRGQDFTEQDLIEFAAKGMLENLDRHSSYFPSDEFQRFFFDLNREYGGIGAFVNFDQDGDFSIVRPIYSGPAYRAGMRSGDKILEVDGWETANHTSEEIISRLKGRPETPVVLKVFRPGWTQPEDITIERRQIQVPSVNSAMLPGKIGYLELVTFGASASDEIDRALRELKDRGAKGIVLDLRNNTGGYLTQAREVVEKFVPGRKVVVYTEGRTEERQNYLTRDRAICDLPLAVLINGFSASASEIVAGALQDHGRAVIVGERSFGKGSVQNLLPLSGSPGEEFEDLNNDGVWEEGEPFTDRNQNGKFDVGPRLKLTVAKYFLPSGRCLHKEFGKDGKVVDPNWGVMPEHVVQLLENKPEDAWKNAAVFALLKKGVFRDYVKKHFDGHKDLFLQIAEGDQGDAARYPEFDAFYQSLDTHLTKDDVRRWLRYEIRDAVSDLRGKTYPGGRALGDPQEDAQLQEASRQLLQRLGTDIRTLDEYRNVLKITFDATAQKDPAPKPGEKNG